MTKILLSTVLFPNRFEVNRGVCIKKQAVELARTDKLMILVPVPYFPPFFPNSARHFYAKIPRKDRIAGLLVRYPRFFIIPKIFRFLHGPFMFVSLFRYYRQVIKDEKPDILLGFWAFPDGFANVLMAKCFKLPVVIGCRGCDINKFTNPYLQRKLIGWALRNCDQVLAVSEALKKEIINRLNVPPHQVTVIPNGIEEEHFYPQDRDKMREKLGLNKKHKIVLCVARLDPIKGVDVLVRAFAQIENKAKQLIVVGDGTEMRYLKQLVKELGLSERVLLVGSKPYNEIPRWMNAADLLVLPSITEGWPNTLMEALSCGKPVVASRVGGVPEIIDSPALGTMVTPGDVDELSRAVDEALSHAWDADIIRARVEGRNWAVVADELRNELHTVLQRHEASQSQV